MKRILLRSGKSPFHAATPQQVIHQDLLGTNSGNLLFSDAMHKILSLPETEVVSNGIGTDPSDANAARINEQFDVFVVPLANAFRPSFRASLDRLSTLIGKLRIPVVVTGVGAQRAAWDDEAAARAIDPSVQRFARAVLEKSASIGVRGEYTADYLKELGFRDVEIIGCPSMFLHGETFPALDAVEHLTPASRIAMNVSPTAHRAGDIAEIVGNTLRRYPEVQYFAQNLRDAELLFWGDTSEASGATAQLPRMMTHRLLAEDRARVPTDPFAWIQELRGFDFSFGTRIHGNIAALLAGTPAVVLCHDSRTEELCRYFGIPHRMLSEVPGNLDPAELYAKADFTALRKGHQERFERFTGFLERNGLQNTFTHGDRGRAFDARLESMEFHGPIRKWHGGDDGALGYRISALREMVRREGTKRAEAARRIEELTEHHGALEARIGALTERLGEAERKLAKRRTAEDGAPAGGPALRLRRFFGV